MHTEFSYLYQKPVSTGQLRTTMADFNVFEILPFEPCGEGEHLLIYLRKTGANTVFVARELAKYFGVKEMLVSYAGLKDRFAVTEQWFGVHLPGKQTFDLSDLAIDGVEVLQFARHNKKLRIGSLSGNRFELVLRNVTAIECLLKRWQDIVSAGVPNYFGEQRFGIDGGNLDRAKALFAGSKVKDKKKRGMYLSAARSYVFNQMVSARIDEKLFNALIPGDVCMLSGTQSVFKAPEVTDELAERLVQQDIDITAAMWGAGALMTEDQALALEQKVAAQYPEFCQGLPRFDLKQERRRMRLTLSDGQIHHNGNTVTLRFFLPSGCYATTVLRELLVYQDMTARVVSENNNNNNSGTEV